MIDHSSDHAKALFALCYRQHQFFNQYLLSPVIG